MEKKPEMEFDPQVFEKALNPDSKQKARLKEAFAEQREQMNSKKTGSEPR